MKRQPVNHTAHKFLIALVFFFGLSLAGTSLSAGQATSSGTVVGSITDPSGAVIPDATITVTDMASKSARTTVSNKAGQYIVPDVPPGTYDVKATRAGFSTDEIPDITVSVGSQTTANFRMTVGAENTTVEVTASNADLQTMNASTGTTVDPSMVQALPTIGREVATFTTMQPGVTPGGNVAGTTTDQASFTLDGGNNSNDMDGTLTTYTTSYATSTTGGFLGAAPQGTMPMPQDSIEEFKVATTGQTADFNNSSGSQTQAVTKRGRDRWTGTVYEYYLDNNFNGNTWQNNFPGTGYTPKPSYHFSRFGAAAGGPIAPKFLGGKTYLFANYEGFRYPLASTYERTVPSYEYLQLGQLSFTGTTYSAAQLKAADPRGLGMNPVLTNFYKTQLPVAPVGDAGSTGADGTKYAGSFDKSCGGLSTTLCDSNNTIGYKANVSTPQSSNFLATRLDHDFGQKWHFMASYRYYELVNSTTNQIDIGGALPGDTIGVPKAVAPHTQAPWYLVVGLTTNISASLTNDFHYSFLRDQWQWTDANAPAQVAGADGAIEPLGEYANTVLSPYNVNSQSIRVRTWDGKDNFFSDNLTKLKGNHLIQVGGQFQHNSDYFSRSDNGASINFTPTYQIGDSSGGGNIGYTGGTPGTAACTTGTGLNCVGAGTAANARMLDTYYGLVTDTQVANSYSNAGGSLSLNPSLTPAIGHASIPYYNIYATDTWHAKPSLTFNLGLSYAIEMPPTERNGTQAIFTDATGNPIRIEQWLASRKAAALSGQIFNPEIGYTLIKNVPSGRKYPYDPYYGAVSPRLSVIWNPNFSNAFLQKLFGNGSTAIRGGYGRIYGRVNGDAQVLPLLAGPGPLLATQCKYAQSATTGAGGCNQSNYNDTTAYRFGPDGLSPLLAPGGVPATLPQPFHPGFDGPGVSLSPGVDPSMRPNDVDTFNLSVQRQINRHMLVEVGYIGRIVHHEFMQLNPNVVPYMLSLGGQSFESAYLAIETAFNCTTTASQCAKSVAPTATVTPQPFFEAALGGAGSAYCSKYSSCTAAVVAKQTAAFRAQRVFGLWQALDNNVNGANGAGFVFARSLMGTATSNSTYGAAGQMVSGVSSDTPIGHSNYNGGYVSFKASSFHGLTAQENLTWSKALGLGANNQSSSGTVAEDSFDINKQYGRQAFDQRIIFNTFIVYETPWYRSQSGIIGRLAGGWTLSPIVTAGTGQPLQCTTNNSGQNFGGEDGANFTDNENCIFNTPYTGGAHTHRGVTGGMDSNGIAVGTNTKGSGAAAINMFTNPVAVFDSVRAPILGLDAGNGGSGAISGLGYLNLDFSVKKRIMIHERYSLELSGVFQNVMNHLDFANPSLSLQSAASWGVTKTQGNAPRQFQMGARAYF
ncbi:carboxypeptidase-like regulatory domain-containing protein [Granulicella sp. 5B5]|uniref:carboxypeptidase-like regulatory domain-containing protein n=1 Tax=Granulicella sp. 5B5 TaxID=1617967 RepID=UPI0015F6FA7B|nr:carboxypeptidase-like regulatory domain-containing protein [Granulicella sp. 5B5]